MFQINTNTHFIDASEVYGSSDSDARKLRTMEAGMLNFSISGNGQMFCPFQKETKIIPSDLLHSTIQFDTGYLLFYPKSQTTVIIYF